MVPVPLSRLQASRKEEIEDWPYLDEGTLLKTRSRKVCMTCHRCSYRCQEQDCDVLSECFRVSARQSKPAVEPGSGQ